MGLARLRRALGYSQESFAQALGVDRTTVGRWEGGRSVPQPPLRPEIAELLHIDLAELDLLVAPPQLSTQEPARSPLKDDYGPRGVEDMIRRDFLRVITVSGALAAVSTGSPTPPGPDPCHGAASAFSQMNEHLWRVYQLARSKASVLPIVHEQLSALNRTLRGRSDAEVPRLCRAAADLFQLAGELAFDDNRYSDAAASYALAASASKEVGAFDLWACALVRHAYVDLYQCRFQEAADLLVAAEGVARRGDSALSTRHWVASVQAEAHAGLGDLSACERALDEAEKVTRMTGGIHNGGWLRFDGSRLAEERGARYVQLGRLDLAEKTLQAVLAQGALAEGQSFRRRGVVLADLAAIGAKRRDADQVLAFGHKAHELARESSSGYAARRLQELRAGFGPLARDGRIAELGAQIDALSKT